MRQYEPVWIKLKKEKQVSITAHRSMHKRIIKAVTKEKWMDTAYKLEMFPIHAIMTHTRKGSIVTFILTLYTDLTQVTEKDL
jgi:hypothetical protein